MNLGALIQDDFQVVDDLETITYSAMLSDESDWDFPQTIPNCLRRMASKKDIENYSDITMVWHLWRSVCDALDSPVVPKRGDKIFRRGQVFIVKAVDIETIETNYKCYCYLERDGVYGV